LGTASERQASAREIPAHVPETVASLLDRLSPAQRPAALDLGHTAIIAGPGSGKTTTMVAKAAYLISLYGPKAVAMTTFTNAATAEMRTRLQQVVGAGGVRGLLISTLHGAMRKTLQGDSAQSSRSLIGEHEAKALQKRFIYEVCGDLTDPDTEELLNAIGRLRSRYPRRTEPLTQNEVDQAAAVILPRYLEFLEQENKMDLDEILKISVESIERGNSRPLQKKFLIVDEYQDTDETQHAWVKLHAQAGCKVTIVGDDDQSIYGFRGSIGYRSMADFISTFSPSCYEVTTTYRTAPLIMQAATNVIRHNPERLEKRIVSAVQGQAGTFDVIEFGLRHGVRMMRMDDDCGRFLEAASVSDDEQDEECGDVDAENGDGQTVNVRAAELEAATAVMNMHRMMLDHGGRAAILGRNNADLNMAETIARFHAIPYYRPGGRAYLDPEIVTGITSIVECGFLPLTAARLAHVLELVRMPREYVRDIIEYVRQRMESDADDVVSILYEPTLYERMVELDQQTRLRQVRDILVSWTDTCLVYGRCANKGMEEEFLLALDQVRAFVMSAQHAGGNLRSQIGILFDMIAKSKGDLRERVQKMKFLLQKSKSEKEDGKALYLGTLHSSKGQEFDYVWILRCEDRNEEDSEEARRLLYVGMTRAKTYLCISSSSKSGISPMVFGSLSMDASGSLEEKEKDLQTAEV